MTLITRGGKGTKLTVAEMDGNLTYLDNKVPYKVYTALLTQSGGNIPYYANDEILTIGASYQITNTDGDTVDFTNIGAPNNNLNTWFVATGEIANSWGETNSGNLYNNIGAPVTTVLENTIGSIVWSYNAIGDYIATLNGAFTLNKTLVFIGAKTAAWDGLKAIDTNIYLVDSFHLYTSDNTSTFVNDILFNTPIEIRVYN